MPSVAPIEDDRAEKWDFRGDPWLINRSDRDYQMVSSKITMPAMYRFEPDEMGFID